MGYSTEVIRRARARLAEAKADRESENEQHLRQAYAQVPRLREIDKQLRVTMAMAAQAAFASGGDFNSAMDQVRDKNLALQSERQKLVAEHFEEGFLDDRPICDICGGSGYVGSNMCECLRKLCSQEQKKELTLLSGTQEDFSRFRLDYYSNTYDPKYRESPRTIMNLGFQKVRRYATSFTTDSGNLLFIGNTGLGKTFLSACVAQTVTERGYAVIYESASHLFSKLEKARFSPTDENRREADKLFHCDLLIIDDLGTELPGQFVNAALYSLINDRLLTGKPMVISTNLNVDEIKVRYTPQIASRLHGEFQRIKFVGEDIRVLKARGY